MQALEVKRRTSPGEPLRGITVVEVLFAMGIVVIGLFAVIALMPLAGAEARKGLLQDRMAMIGRSAFRDFDVRGLRRVDNWATWNPTAGRMEHFNPGPRESFCIDPQFYAWHGANNTLTNRSTVFPFYIPPQANPQRFVRMSRVTLRVWPRHRQASGSIVTTAMGISQANQIFQSRDDLVFQTPEDGTLMPQQYFDPTALKPRHAGEMSWFATLVPKDDAVGVSQNRYILSIIVLHARNASFPLNGFAERVVNVRNLWSQGFAGGDMELEATSAEALDIQTGSWIMLSANTFTPSAPQSINPMFRWYRVLSTERTPRQDPNNNALWLRDVTLEGQDWDRPEWLINAQNFPTQATIVPGIVGVFEKTVRLETSSLWTN